MKPKIARFVRASTFACPLCKEALKFQDHSLVCTNRHSFDIAKYGYVNLAPQIRQSKDYDKGEQLVFDENGLVSAEYEFGGASLTDYGTAAGGVYGGQTGGFLLEFIPSGVKLADTENFKDSSDISRDRLWTGVGIQSFGEQGSFYYRIK